MGCLGSPNYLNLSPYKVSQPLHKVPKSLGSHWFLIQVISTIIDVYTFGNSEGIHFSSENMVANGWFTMYLNRDQANFLRESTYFEIYPIENKNKILTESDTESDGYYIRASKDWEPPEGSRVASRISEDIFYIENLIITPDLQNDPRILKITPSPKKQSLNRYVSGFLQSEKHKSYYDPTMNIYGPIRSLHRLGLNGRGQTVNVVDTGVDVFNAFFYDPEPANNLASITGKTNKNHRKIVRIEPIVDNTDTYRGHGTHVAGTACGSAFCTDCGLKQYNGIAPEAKLYFSDIGNTTSNELSGTVDLYEQYQIFERLDVHVSSNSWGYPKLNREIDFNYNKAAYDHPYVLYVFAAGNSGTYNTINCPASSKNVLTVSSSSFVSSSYLEFFQSPMTIEDETYTIQAEETMDTLIFKNSIGDPMKYFINLTLTQFDESVENPSSYYSGTVVLLNKEPGNDEDICTRALSVEQNGAEAALYVATDSTFRCDEEKLPKIPMIRIIEKENVSTILKMKKVSILPFSGDERELPEADALSSKGPADTGLKKPDIILPGSNIYSAKSNGPEMDETLVTTDYSDNVCSKSGTSMATPAASGLAIIILQYLREGFYPKLTKGSGNSILPSSCLLKALLINTAVKPDQEANENKMSPRNDVGFGTPFLDRILGFKDTGLRFIDGETFQSNSHRVYKINLDSNAADLSITLVYLDPPLNPDNEAVLFADLDLYVKSPTGQIYYGNNVQEGDALTLIERVIFEKGEIPANGGEFEIHVISNKYPIKSQRIMYSIVVNGPFDMSNVDKNPLFLASKEPSDTECPNDCNGNGKCEKGRCVCSGSFIGPFCNIKQEILNPGTSYEETIAYKDIKYFKVPLKENFDEISFDIIKNFNFATAYFCTTFSDSPGKLTDPSWECHLACPNLDPNSAENPFFANYSFKIPKEENPQFFNLAVFTAYFEPVPMKIDNILLSISKPTEAPKTESTTNSAESFTPKTPQEFEVVKISTVGIVFAVIAVVMAVAAIVLLVLIFIKKRFSFKNDSSIHISLMSQDTI